MPVEGRDFQYIGEISLLLGICNYVLFGSEDFSCAIVSTERLILLSCFIAHNPNFLAFPTASPCSILRIPLPEAVPSVSNKTKHNNKKQQTTHTKKPNKKRSQGCEGSPTAGCSITVDMLSASGLSINVLSHSFKGLDTMEGKQII